MRGGAVAQTSRQAAWWGINRCEVFPVSRHIAHCQMGGHVVVRDPLRKATRGYPVPVLQAGVGTRRQEETQDRRITPIAEDRLS